MGAVLATRDYEIIGNVHYDDGDYPVYCVKIDNNAPDNVIISSGVHGTEPASVAANLKLLQILDSRGDLKSYNYYIIPVVNPWGWIKGVRYNYDGMEINRDFSPGKVETQEAQILLDYIKDINPVIAIDLHESNTWGNYYFVYTREMRALMEEFINENEDNFPFENDTRYMGYIRARRGIIYLNRLIIVLGRRLDRSAFSNYFLYDTEYVTTIESSKYGWMEDRIDFHIQSVLHILTHEKL